MAEDAARPATEGRRASVDSATQTQEELGVARQSTSLARAQSVGSRRQVAQRAPAHDILRATPRAAEAVALERRDGGGGGGAPAVRLDMDLDVDIKLQAKIKGEIELSIL